MKYSTLCFSLVCLMACTGGKTQATRNPQAPGVVRLFVHSDTKTIGSHGQALSISPTQFQDAQLERSAPIELDTEYRLVNQILNPRVMRYTDSETVAIFTMTDKHPAGNTFNSYQERDEVVLNSPTTLPVGEFYFAFEIGDKIDPTTLTSFLKLNATTYGYPFMVGENLCVTRAAACDPGNLEVSAPDLLNLTLFLSNRFQPMTAANVLNAIKITVDEQPV